MAMCGVRNASSHPKQRNSLQSASKPSYLENRNKNFRYNNARVIPQQLEVRGKQIKLTPRHGKSFEQTKPAVKRLVRSPNNSNIRSMVLSTPNSDCDTSTTLFKDSLQKYVEDSYNLTFGRHIQLLTNIISDPDGQFLINPDQQDVEMDSDASSLRGIEDGIVEKMEGITLDQHVKPVITVTPAASNSKDGIADKRQESESAGKHSEFLSVPIIEEQEELPKHKRSVF